MQLTPEQRTTLKTAIEAAPELTAPLAAGDDMAVVTWCNAPSTFTVWRTSLPIEEVMANGFIWTEIDNLSVGKARIWEWMSRLGTINPSRQNVRQGLRDCFEVAAPLTFGNRGAGTGGLQPHLRRLATNAEQMLATGTGTVAQPGQLGVEGRIDAGDVAAILRGA